MALELLSPEDIEAVCWLTWESQEGDWACEDADTGTLNDAISKMRSNDAPPTAAALMTFCGERDLDICMTLTLYYPCNRQRRDK